MRLQKKSVSKHIAAMIGIVFRTTWTWYPSYWTSSPMAWTTSETCGSMKNWTTHELLWCSGAAIRKRHLQNQRKPAWLMWISGAALPKRINIGRSDGTLLYQQVLSEAGFEKQFLQPITAYLASLRSAHAKRLLRFSEESVEEISVECDWIQLHYFSLVFRGARELLYAHTKVNSILAFLYSKLTILYEYRKATKVEKPHRKCV